MSDFKISIPKPCHEDWNAMNPKNDGRFCSSCEKTVVDFTKMEVAEIKEYFSAHREEKVCGQFNTIHITTPIPRFHQMLLNAHSYVENKFSGKILKSATLAIIGLSMTVVGCNSSKTKGEPALSQDKKSCESKEGQTLIKGDVDYSVKPDTAKTKEGYLLGVPAYNPENDTIKSK